MSEANFRVVICKPAFREGNQIELSPVSTQKIRNAVFELANFPMNSSDYDFESAFGVKEFKFKAEGKELRVFVHQDDELRTMVVLHVMLKKTARLSEVTKITVQARLRNYQLRRGFLKKTMEEKRQKLYLLTGGRDEQSNEK